VITVTWILYSAHEEVKRMRGEKKKGKEMK
jgi:hypothetical protein